VQAVLVAHALLEQHQAPAAMLCFWLPGMADTVELTLCCMQTRCTPPYSVIPSPAQKPAGCRQLCPPTTPHTFAGQTCGVNPGT
jgi:hypothetical protein